MKKFIIKIFVFLGICTLVCALIFLFDISVIRDQYQTSYNASLVDKFAYAESITEPKIILAGDSNVAFGFDSELIEKELGTPVVNMGLQRSLGNVFLEQSAFTQVRNGDIVVLCHSSYSDNDCITDNLMALKTLEHHSELWKIPRVKDYSGLITTYPNYIAESFASWLTRSGNKTYNNPYSRYAFNAHGDVIDKPEAVRVPTEKLFTEGSQTIPRINDTCIDRLNELNKKIIEKGAVLVIAGYPIGDGEYTPDKESYRQFEMDLREKLDCAVISDFTDYFIPYKYFYNTILHLDTEGARIRSEQLIDDLKQWKQSTEH